ncbi:MAG: hypothetical protein LBG45_08555, partial [Dysgonamonadaceae bacterium]|nr:hypothetical protein [Dysgonamonadaceae bacterium]
FVSFCDNFVSFTDNFVLFTPKPGLFTPNPKKKAPTSEFFAPKSRLLTLFAGNYYSPMLRTAQWMAKPGHCSGCFVGKNKVKILKVEDIGLCLAPSVPTGSTCRDSCNKGMTGHETALRQLKCTAERKIIFLFPILFRIFAIQFYK